MIQSNNKQPIIITGTPHSGTSMLARILGGHPDNCLITELKSIGSDGKKKHAPEDISQINDCLLWWDNFSYPFWGGSGKPLVREPIFNEPGMNRVRETYQNEAGGKRLVLKNPEFINRAHFIDKLFKDAFVVVCVRHPLMALQSIAESGNEKFMLLTPRHFGLPDDLLLKAANSWKESFDTYNREKNENWIMVKYEDVVFNTKPTLSRLFDFLKINDADYLEKASSIPRDLKHSYFWIKKQFNKSDYQKEILSCISPGARELGYSLSFDDLNIKKDSFTQKFAELSASALRKFRNLKYAGKTGFKKIIRAYCFVVAPKRKFVGSLIFSAHIPGGDVLLTEGSVIENALASIRKSGENSDGDISLEILERDFFRLRGKKYIVLLDRSNRCKPGIIVKNTGMYPKDAAAPKKTYIMSSKVKYINKEAYGI